VVGLGRTNLRPDAGIAVRTSVVAPIG